MSIRLVWFLTVGWGLLVMLKDDPQITPEQFLDMLFLTLEQPTK